MDGSGGIKKACLILGGESDRLLLFPESASEAGKRPRKTMNYFVMKQTD